MIDLDENNFAGSLPHIYNQKLFNRFHNGKKNKSLN